MSEAPEKSATYKVMLERYRPAYRGAANLAKAARICQRWLARAAVALAVVQFALFLVGGGRDDEWAAFGMASLGAALVLFMVGAALSFFSSNLQSKLDGTVFQTPGLTDDEKLALVTEVRAGLVIAPSAAVAHATPTSTKAEP